MIFVTVYCPVLFLLVTVVGSV